MLKPLVFLLEVCRENLEITASDRDIRTSIWDLGIPRFSWDALDQMPNPLRGERRWRAIQLPWRRVNRIKNTTQKPKIHTNNESERISPAGFANFAL